MLLRVKVERFLMLFWLKNRVIFHCRLGQKAGRKNGWFKGKQ